MLGIIFPMIKLILKSTDGEKMELLDGAIDVQASGNPRQLRDGADACRNRGEIVIHRLDDANCGGVGKEWMSFFSFRQRAPKSGRSKVF